MLAFYACVALMQMSHGPYYTFLTLHLEHLGYSRGVIGMLWALGVVAEVLMFLAMSRILTRFSVRRVLMASFLLAAHQRHTRIERQHAGAAQLPQKAVTGQAIPLAQPGTVCGTGRYRRCAGRTLFRLQLEPAGADPDLQHCQRRGPGRRRYHRFSIARAEPRKKRVRMRLMPRNISTSATTPKAHSMPITPRAIVWPVEAFSNNYAAPVCWRFMPAWR